MYSFNYILLLGSIFLLNLVTLSYGQTPDEEQDDGATTRKRPILRKIIILVGLAIGFAALCWALHKAYKACRRWSQKRRRMIGRKEFDAMMADLEKQEINFNTSDQKDQTQEPSDRANGKYMPLNNAIPEEEPLMTSDDEVSHERASQHVTESDSKKTEKGEASTPLLSDVPFDPSGTQTLNLSEQVVGENDLESSTSRPQGERETQA
ncbi:uncharacterized protein LOC121408960 [Lytechinus variegatus]|uniref:uncharacterized protein LOC121408960 n=1 Tax=Lytechinus variegatus TaxID=7654 RepID=UPI001BB26EA0|nr:uncharacterized protein LOC121408960 [Lytechinus variegatus]